MIRLTLLMVAAVLTTAIALQEAYIVGATRTAPYELTERQREEAHRRAYAKELAMYKAEANWREINKNEM